MSLQHSFADYYHQAVSFLFSDEPAPLAKTGYSSSRGQQPHPLQFPLGSRVVEWNRSRVWSPAGRASVKVRTNFTPHPEPDPQQLLERPHSPAPRTHLHASPCRRAWQVVAPQGEGEIAAVHAHHDVRGDGNEGRGPLPRLTPASPVSRSNGVRRAAGSGDQQAGAPSCRGVCVYGGTELDSTFPSHPPPPQPQGATSVRNGAGGARLWAARGPP